MVHKKYPTALFVAFCCNITHPASVTPGVAVHDRARRPGVAGSLLQTLGKPQPASSATVSASATPRNANSDLAVIFVSSPLSATTDSEHTRIWLMALRLRGREQQTQLIWEW
jgi:hypothetical protein